MEHVGGIMPRKLLTKLLPDRQALRKKLGSKWYVRPFQALLHDPALWHIGRHSSCGALALALFICCLPIPGHMLLAVLGALYWRLNLPIAVAGVWVNNPFTLGPIYYGGYKIGALMLGIRPHHFPDELTLSWLLTELYHIWEPLWLGCVVLGVTLAVLGYILLALAWQLSIRSRWLRRQSLRRLQHTDKKN